MPKADSPWTYSSIEGGWAVFHGEESTDPIAVFNDEDDAKLFRTAKVAADVAEEEQDSRENDETYDAAEWTVEKVAERIKHREWNYNLLPATNATIPWWNSCEAIPDDDADPCVVDEYTLADLVNHAVGPFIDPVKRNVFAALVVERDYQEAKWGARHQSLAGFILIAEELVAAARVAWVSGKGPAVPEAICHMLKLTAVGTACLEEFGIVTREMLAKQTGG